MDDNYASILQVINEGSSIRGLRADHPAREFKSVWDKLSTFNGPNGQCLLCEGRIVVPQGLRAQYLADLHHRHPSADAMWLEARSKVWWPGLKGEIENLYDSCLVCQEIQRLHYEPPPMLINEELAAVLKPMDELRVDWGSVGLRHFHVAVDLATSYLWVREFQVMSTQNSLLHLKEIMGGFGRALSVGGDSGPSYRAAYEEELGAMGVFTEHGGIHHPASQGLAERKVGLFKQALERNPSRPGAQIQELVNALNSREGFPPGVGSPAQRMFGRDLRLELPTLPAQEPVLAAQICEKLAASRDKAQGRKQNCRAIHFEVGESALLWDQGMKCYVEPVTVQAPNPGLDGGSRSFWVMGENGRQKLVHSSWLIKAPPPAPEQEEA